MARQEQLIVTDQDNAMILDNRFDPEKHDAYFSDVAKFVSDGLAACGYSYCTGDVMATNPKWRQPLRVWQTYFTDWIESPTPESLLTSNIFFDLDGVYGRTAFAETLRVLIAQKAKGNSRFLASMARNALRRTPPIGFFKDFVRDALEFISLVRARNQAQDIVAGQEPDNSMEPENLSEFERKNLRDAFLILANAQKYLKFRYQPGRLA